MNLEQYSTATRQPWYLYAYSGELYTDAAISQVAEAENRETNPYMWAPIYARRLGGDIVHLFRRRSAHPAP